MIPKIVHYCWLSNDPLPEEFQKNLEGWKRILKDYEFIRWDFSRFDKSSSAWVAEAFDNKKYAFAADYIRLYAVYNYGGIYMDLDVEVLKSFDELLKRPYMLAFERSNRRWLEPGCFGAKKGNLFLKECLDYYENRHFILKNGEFDTFPLPQIMYKIIQKKKIRLKVYPWYYFTAKSFDTGEVMVTDKTYTIHHFAGSWLLEEEKEDYEMARKYIRKYGRLGHLFSDYMQAVKRKGITGVFGVTKGKIKRVLRRWI